MRPLRAMWVTISNLFRQTSTYQFPRVIRPRPERYRVGFALLKDEHGEELCIGCLACERICPSAIITVKQGPKRESAVTGKKRGWAEELTIDTVACLTCELCVQVCPTDALVMTRAPERAALSREDLFLDMKKLYANGLERQHGWATGTKLMGMQEPEGGKKKQEVAA